MKSLQIDDGYCSRCINPECNKSSGNGGLLILIIVILIFPGAFGIKELFTSESKEWWSKNQQEIFRENNPHLKSYRISVSNDDEKTVNIYIPENTTEHDKLSLYKFLLNTNVQNTKAVHY